MSKATTIIGRTLCINLSALSTAAVGLCRRRKCPLNRAMFPSAYSATASRRLPFLRPPFLHTVRAPSPCWSHGVHRCSASRRHIASATNVAWDRRGEWEGGRVSFRTRKVHLTRRAGPGFDFPPAVSLHLRWRGCHVKNKYPNVMGAKI